MRITTQMINPLLLKGNANQSLLSYLNQNKTSNNALLSAMNQLYAAKASKTLNSPNRVNINYEKLDQKAEALEKQAQSFTDESAKSMFAQAKSSGNYEDVYKHVDSFVNSYNQTLDAMKSGKDSMTSFYGSMLKRAASDQSADLSAVGITVQKDGSLTVDQEKLRAADKETLEKILGASSTFSQNVNFIAGRITNYAQSNLVSASNGYNAFGAYTSAISGRYNFWG